MKHLLFSSLFLILLAYSAFAQNGSISGRVTYANDIGLDNATVQIVKLGLTARTDLEGNYRLENVPPGRYSVVVHQEGFSDSVRTVRVVAGEELKLDFLMRIVALREEVTITAGGTEQTIVESVDTTTSIGTNRIAEKASTSIGEVLETETGVAKRSFGPGAARPVIRGFDGDRVLVLDNGVRSGSVGSQSGDHGEAIDPLNAERIEVVKGPATLLYGSNAIGGVVNVIGNDEDTAHEGFRGNLTLVGGSADKQFAGSGGIEYGHGKWLFRADISGQRANDYQSPIGKVPNSASRSNTETFGVGYFADKAYVRGIYSLDIRRYGVPFAALFEGEGASLGSGSVLSADEEIDIRVRQQRFRAIGGFRNLSGGFITDIKYNLDFVDYRHKELETFLGADLVGTTFTNKTFSYRSLFEQARYGKLAGRFGFEGFSRDYRVEGEEQLITGKVDHDSVSLFALEELQFDRVKLQFGARLENNRYGPVNPGLMSRSFTGLSASIASNIGLWKGGAFVTNYTSSFRSPALEELYNRGPHVGTLTFELGNEDLTNERANGIDVSVRHLSDRVRFSAGLYFYKINDFVFLAPQDENNDGDVDIVDGLPLSRYSQADAEYFGGEFELNVTLNKFIGGFFNADTVRAKLVDLDTDLIRIPPARIKLGLDLRYKNLSVRPEALFVGRQDKVFTLEAPTAGYGTLGITGSYVIGRPHVAHILTFNAYNLTDKLYRNHVSFIKEFAPEVGRGVRVSYSIRFF